MSKLTKNIYYDYKMCEFPFLEIEMRAGGGGCDVACVHMCM